MLSADLPEHTPLTEMNSLTRTAAYLTQRGNRPPGGLSAEVTFGWGGGGRSVCPGDVFERGGTAIGWCEVSPQSCWGRPLADASWIGAQHSERELDEQHER